MQIETNEMYIPGTTVMIYFNTIIANGCIPVNTKTTRFRNSNHTLSVFSDHFINFICKQANQW
jgi:hypothetical protein